MISRKVGFAAAIAASTLSMMPPAEGAVTRDEFPMDCDNGATYSVSFKEQGGTWSALRETDGSAAIIPVAYGDIIGTVYDASGNLAQTFTYPGDVKRGTHDYDARCSFSFSHISDGTGPDPVGYSLVVNGSVLIRVTPRSVAG